MSKYIICVLLALSCHWLLVAGESFVETCQSVQEVGEPLELIRFMHKQDNDGTQLDGPKLWKMTSEFTPKSIGEAIYHKISTLKRIDPAQFFYIHYLNPCNDVQSELVDYVDDYYEQMDRNDRETQECLALFAMCEIVASDRAIVKGALLDMYT